jgi:CrcB protein
MYNIILVALGGAAGSVLRFVVARSLNLNFPTGTLLVNLSGCFLIGILWGLFARNVDEGKRLLLITGFCGGFTTFSSFTLEGMRMIMDNRLLAFTFYTCISVIGGLLLTFFGYKLTT